LFISERFPPQRGGVATSALRHARGLAPQLDRLDVLHLTADLPAGYVNACEHAAGDGCFTVHSVGRLKRDDESLQLLETVAAGLISYYHHNIIHGFYAVGAGTVAAVIAAQRGLPCVISVRGNDLDRSIYQASRAPLLDTTVRLATRILCVSHELRHKINTLWRRDDAEFVANSVDAAVFHPAVAERPRADGVTLGFFGEMRFKKGMHPLVAALEHIDARLLLVGGVRADEAAEYQRLRTTFRTAAQRITEVKYCRDEDALRDLYHRCDLVVCPSLWDGMPNALLEAMACGRPCLARRVGGIPDLIEHGKTGWLAAPTDDFGESISAVLQLSIAEREAVGRRAREHVLAHHAPADEIAAVLDVYREAISQRI
jgi:glycosyltransferase involved in cell wall biosynthesis